jgi:glutamine synthetase adenylyltransferase
VKEIANGIRQIRTKSASSFPVEMNLIDLKKSSGGLNDIEDVAHYYLLSAAESDFKLIGESIPQILSHLSTQFKQKKVLNELADNYIFIKNLEIFNQLFCICQRFLDKCKFEKLLDIWYDNGTH